MRAALHDVKLDGIAKGGELVLLEMINPNPRYIRVETHAGESAESVIARMAAAVNELSPFHPDHARMHYVDEHGQERAGVPPIHPEGKLLTAFGGFPGNYIFAGTETGLGIPPAPTSLSAVYDPESQNVSLRWENPDEPYDAVKANFANEQPGTSTSVTGRWGPPRKQQLPPNIIDRDQFRSNNGLRRITVIACRNGVLSNAAVITLNYDDNYQEELDTQPFTGGICPNWKRWSRDPESVSVLLEQGTKGEWKQFEQKPKAPLKPDDKPFYQLIKTRSSNVIGGVCRKFLGLTPGHTYRLWVRMNTLDMDQVHDNWYFSFHAVPNGKDVTLTAEQMAGTAPLPDGSGGTPAALVASFGPGSTTQGKFVERSTDKPGPESQVLDIPMPAGAEVITVWFRYSGAPSTGVGFDWIKLKDITTK